MIYSKWRPVSSRIVALKLGGLIKIAAFLKADVSTQISTVVFTQPFQRWPVAPKE